MNPPLRLLRIALPVLLAPFAAPAETLPALKPVPRVLPPVGDKLREEDRLSLTAELSRLTAAFAGLLPKSGNADAEVFLKAVRYALELKEFYKPEDARKARDLLAEADRRVQALRQGQAPWRTAKGLVVRGYYSAIDGSAQPFGLEIPGDAPAENAPAWMWLHGRNDRGTDLHFISERLKKPGQFHPPGTVIVHPFGRFCNGFKGAGGRDVLDLRDFLIREKRVDPARTALAGFSMGGAGAWLLGARHPDRWKVIHAGAGFVDVRRYRNLSDQDVSKIPPWERALWGLNDVPGYVRNLLNVPVIAYSGERDKQRAAAEIMAEAFQQQGAALTHFIGPGAEHAYEPATRARVEEEIQRLLLSPVETPRKLTFQTRTLACSGLHWLRVSGLEQHWLDSRIDAEFTASTAGGFDDLTIGTENITELSADHPLGETFPAGFIVRIDGSSVVFPAQERTLNLRRRDGVWKAGASDHGEPRKRPGLQGPIDDAFNAPFLHVLPDGDCADPVVDRWVKFESAHQRDYWRRLMRGDARVKRAAAVTAEDVRDRHLILWGDPAANEWIAKTLPRLPLKWSRETIQAGGQVFPSAGRVPVMIYPNPLNPEKYLVLNSGLTFRENHGGTNSLQNPRLPDWVVMNLSAPPDVSVKLSALG